MLGLLSRLWPTSDPRHAELASLRLDEDLAAARLRAPRIRRRVEKAKLSESSLALDWVSALGDLYRQILDTSDAWQVIGPTGPYQRLHGRNFPLFQSEQQLNMIRAPSRVLCQSNCYAIGLIAGVGSYILGDGFTYQAEGKHDSTPPELVAAVQEVIDDFLEMNCWQGGEEIGVEEEAFRRSIEDGEVFLVHSCDSYGKTHVRFVEPELVTQPTGADFAEWGFGILSPPHDTAKREAYNVRWSGQVDEDEVIDARDMVFIRCNTPRNVKRGLPDFSFETLDAIDLAGKLTGNLGETAAEQAAIAFIRQHETATVDQVQSFVAENGDYRDTDPLTGRLEEITRLRRGRHEDIPKGMNYVQGPTAANAPAHIEILLSLLRAGGRRWQAPDWLVAGDASNNNYASSLVADSPFVKNGSRKQKRTYVPAFRRSVEIALENWCRYKGGIRAYKVGEDGRVSGSSVYSWQDVRRLVEVQVTPSSMESRNKLEEAQRDQIYVSLGTKDRQTVAEEQGYDWDTVNARNEEWQAQNGGPGMPLGMPGLGGEPAFGESIRECGGQGGEPGPCPDKGQGDAKAPLLHRAWAKFKGALTNQFNDLADFYGRPVAFAIVATAALPIPGSSAAPIAAKLVAKAVRAYQASKMESAGGEPPDLDVLADAVVELWTSAVEATGEPMPDLDRDAIKAALQKQLEQS